MNKQTTIKKEVSCYGIGLHTGLKSSITFKPAPINSGIIFNRIDKKNKQIRVSINNINDLDRGTSLSSDSISVYSVEHLLSAIYSIGINNLSIDISNKEVPIFDGSALPFYNLLNQAGIIEQNSYQDELTIKEKVFFKYEDSLISIYPYNDLKITVLIDYDNKYIGEQKYSFDFSNDSYLKEIAPARTFCLYEELVGMRKRGLLKGATLESGLVFLSNVISKEEIEKLIVLFKIDSKISYNKNSMILDNKKLRFINEPARHKILDLIGDISILGKRIKGHIVAERIGHRSNYEFIKFLEKNKFIRSISLENEY